MNTPHFQPLRHIALAISGGGFRAACFGLGALSYLHRVGLLSRVKFMSSASGGSFPVALYGQYIHQGKTFEQFYEHLFECMTGENLIEKAIKLLNTKSIWKERPTKNRNLINAFALAYDELIFEGGQLGIIKKENHDTHLEEICINATEFNNGLSFRFQQGVNQRKVGNKYLHFDNNEKTPNQSKSLKFGDILAASSAFPGGMEPMVFPDDFTHQELNKEEIWENFIQQPAFEDQYKTAQQAFGLMDGGIDDNQGLESALLADKWRRKNHKQGLDDKFAPFDTIIVCDVDSGFMKGYTPPTPEPNKTWLQKLNVYKSLKYIRWAALVLTVLPLLLGIILATTGSLLAGISLGVLGVTALYFHFKYRKKLNDLLTAKQANPFLNMLQKYGSFFWKQPFGFLKTLIKARSKSVFMLVDDIFLNQIRRLQFKVFYQNADYDQRRISTLLHDLSYLNRNNLKQRLNKEVSPEMVKILENNSVIETLCGEARQVPTTLWFDEAAVKNRSQEKVIASGQVTLCFNLLKYLGQLQQEKVALSDHLLNLKSHLEDDWENFKIDPMRLITR